MATRATPLKVTTARRDVIKDSYLVLLNDGVDRDAFLKADTDLAKRVTHRWNPKLLNGFSGTFDSATVEKLRKATNVRKIEQNSRGKRAMQTQNDASPGLAQLCTSNPLPNLNVMTETQFIWRYLYEPARRNDVNVYIVDTGVAANHADFQRQQVSCVTFLGPPHQPYDFHGTHCAGLVAGNKSGVAKSAKIISVLDSFTDTDARELTYESNLAAVQQVWEHLSAAAQTNTRKPAVVLLANIYAYDADDGETQLETVIKQIVALGVPVIVPAGNESLPAADFVPPRMPEVITVGSYGVNRHMFPESCYGASVDIWAPGEKTLGPNDMNDFGPPYTGTCGAAAYVAGLAALYLGSLNPQDAIPTVAAVKAKLEEWSDHVQLPGSNDANLKYLARTPPGYRY